MAKPKRPGKLPSQRRREAETGLNDPQFIAIHEAGHAVATVALGQLLRRVDIIRRHLPEGTSVGFTDAPVDADAVAGLGEEAAMPYMVQTMVGPAAECRLNPGVMDTGAFAGDKEAARRIAAVAICRATPSEQGGMIIDTDELKRNRERLDALTVRSIEEAFRFVEEHWTAIALVATVLMKRKVLTGEEVAALVAEGKRRDEEAVE